jgi:hypothetical protein
MHKNRKDYAHSAIIDSKNGDSASYLQRIVWVCALLLASVLWPCFGFWDNRLPTSKRWCWHTIKRQPTALFCSQQISYIHAQRNAPVSTTPLSATDPYDDQSILYRATGRAGVGRRCVATARKNSATTELRSRVKASKCWGFVLLITETEDMVLRKMLNKASLVQYLHGRVGHRDARVTPARAFNVFLRKILIWGCELTLMFTYSCFHKTDLSHCIRRGSSTSPSYLKPVSVMVLRSCVKGAGATMMHTLRIACNDGLVKLFQTCRWRNCRIQCTYKMIRQKSVNNIHSISHPRSQDLITAMRSIHIPSHQRNTSNVG